MSTKKIETYTSPGFAKILDGKIQDSHLNLGTNIFRMIQDGVVYYNGYFSFNTLKNRFNGEMGESLDEKIYQEFSMNKLYIEDYILNSPQTSLRLRAFLGKILVNEVSQHLLEKFPDQSFIVAAIIDKQKTSFVSITFYSLFRGYTPVIEEPFSETERNFIYVSKIISNDL